MKKITRLCFIVALSLAVFGLLVGPGPRAEAAPLGYATDGRDLWTIDLGTGAITRIGSHRDGFMESIAVDAAGNLFGANTAGQIWSINPLNGIATYIGTTGRGNIEGLDFMGNTLVAVDFNPRPHFWSLNTSNAMPTFMTAGSISIDNVRSMTISGPNQALVRGDLPGPQALWSVDLTTGASVLIGRLLAGNLLAGMDFGTDGVLYGLDISGHVFGINPLNAQMTHLASTGRSGWLGLAIPGSPSIPEPATLLLFGFGAAGMAAQRKMRKRQT